MSRRHRVHVPGGCYHVTLRGNHREAIFGTRRDRSVLNDIVAEVVHRCGARIHGFCWMTNHLHMLIQIPELPLGKIVQRIAQRYSRYRHKQLDTGGHLFERRHGARLVEHDAYFLTVLKYIHMNPVAACIVAKPSDYRWSSHRCFAGIERIPWVTTDFGLSIFSEDRKQARAAYQGFMAQPLSEEEQDLIADLRVGRVEIINSDRYIEKIEDVSPFPDSSSTLNQVVDQFCTENNTTIEQLRSASRGRALSTIRADLASRVINDGIGTLTEVARLLHRNPASVYRLVDRHGHARSNVKRQK